MKRTKPKTLAGIPAPRNRSFSVRLTDSQFKRALAEARSDGRTVADIIRRCVDSTLPERGDP